MLQHARSFRLSVPFSRRPRLRSRHAVGKRMPRQTTPNRRPAYTVGLNRLLLLPPGHFLCTALILTLLSDKRPSVGPGDAVPADVVDQDRDVANGELGIPSAAWRGQVKLEHRQRNQVFRLASLDGRRLNNRGSLLNISVSPISDEVVNWRGVQAGYAHAERRFILSRLRSTLSYA